MTRRSGFERCCVYSKSPGAVSFSYTLLWLFSLFMSAIVGVLAILVILACGPHCYPGDISGCRKRTIGFGISSISGLVLSAHFARCGIILSLSTLSLTIAAPSSSENVLSTLPRACPLQASPQP